MSTLKVPVSKEFGWTTENAEKKILTLALFITVGHKNFQTACLLILFQFYDHAIDF